MRHRAVRCGDLIIYVFFASSEQYETLNLGFERLAELLAPGRPKSLQFVALDAVLSVSSEPPHVSE